MSRVREQCIRPIALLMHDPRKCTRVCRERCCGPAREAADPAESRVLGRLLEVAQNARESAVLLLG